MQLEARYFCKSLRLDSLCLVRSTVSSTPPPKSKCKRASGFTAIDARLTTQKNEWVSSLRVQTEGRSRVETWVQLYRCQAEFCSSVSDSHRFEFTRILVLVAGNWYPVRQIAYIEVLDHAQSQTFGLMVQIKTKCAFESCSSHS